MRIKVNIIRTLICLLIASSVALSAELQYPLMIKDAKGDSVVLWFGMDKTATPGIDRNVDEDELPPIPPSGVFDARFIGDDIDIPQLGLGTLRDIRPGELTQDAEYVFEIRYQTTNNSPMTLSWNLPENVTGHLSDLYGGTYLDKEINGQGHVSISLVKVVERIVMAVSYTSPHIDILSPTAGDVLRIYETVNLEWTSQFVNGDVTISLSRDNGATYEALATVPNTGSYAWTVDGPPSNACRLKISDPSGRIVAQSKASFSIQFVAGINEPSPVDEFVLFSNYPNPFNPSTTIEFSIPVSGMIQADVYSVNGRHVRRLADQDFAAGRHRLKWDALDADGFRVPAGIYFLRLRYGDETKMAKMVFQP